MEGRESHRRRYLLVAGVSAALILVLVVQAGPWQIADSLAKADLAIIAFAIVLYLATIGLRALRWHLLLVASQHRVKGKIVLSQYAVGQALNDITPVKVVGEGARIWGINRLANVPLGTGLSTVMTERVMDLVLVTSLLIVSVAILLPEVPMRSWAPLAAVVAIVALVNLTLIILLRRPDIVEKGGKLSTRFARRFRGGRYAQKVEEKVENAIGSFDLARKNSHTSNRSMLVAATALTLPIWLMEFARFSMIMAALGVFTSIPMIVVTSALSSTVQVFLPGGGGNMAVVTDLFAGHGVALATATAVGLLSVATSIWISIPMALVVLATSGRRSLKYGSLTDPRTAAADPNADK